jgi:hypothetical protein
MVRVIEAGGSVMIQEYVVHQNGMTGEAEMVLENRLVTRVEDLPDDPHPLQQPDA